MHWFRGCWLALVALYALMPVSPVGAATPATTIAVSGGWSCQLDRLDIGMRDRWYARALAGKVRLPGALQNQGLGDDVTVSTHWTGGIGGNRDWWTSPEYARYRAPGHVWIPFWLQPDKHYVGTAWYQRDVTVPPAWKGKRIELYLERAHWATRAWLDDRPLGERESLSTPHTYDLGMRVAPGRHTLTLRVDNRMLVNVGDNAHSVSDETQGNWNGVIGRMELRAAPPVDVSDLQVYPNAAARTIVVRGVLTGAPTRNAAGTVRLSVFPVTVAKTGAAPIALKSIAVKWNGGTGAFAGVVALGPRAATWDEFHPRLYRLEAAAGTADGARSVTFGLRNMGARGRMLTVNGRPLFLRGTLECCIFPLTGYPPTDVASWKRILRICRSYGLNHIRFHSWCPPEAAFVAADEVGFYYQVEIAAWTSVGDGAPVDGWLYREAQRILAEYGNHPSFALMPYGNEPGGRNHVRWLTEWVKHWRATDPRRLYTSASGWPSIAENQYHVTPNPRGPSGWLGRDFGRAIGDLKAPVVVHEMGQWCVYPNFDEIAKYTGPLKPRNFEIFRDSLQAHRMLDQARDFLRASGRLQTLCYKEEVEAAMRTPGVSGVQLLDLHDFPGQGTSLVGVLDPFWDSKGYVTPAEFRRFYGETVPLARLMKRVWTTSETLSADVEIAHFGPSPIRHARPYWKLVSATGRILASGALPVRDIPLGRGTTLGRIETRLSNVPAPIMARLVVGLAGTPFENDWNVWVYPDTQSPPVPSSILVTSVLDGPALQRLASGGKVLLVASHLGRRHPRNSFTPVFWNRMMFDTQACQTLGLLCDPRHPALRGFPTSFHSDWEWADLLERSRAFNMEGLPIGLRPIVQVIDDWNTNRRLGLVFECKAGGGTLLATSLGLDGDLRDRPAARQLRASLLGYMASGAFAPRIVVSVEALSALVDTGTQSVMRRLGARVVQVDSEDSANGNVAGNAIDGDPDTFWHTRWQPSPDPMPHSLAVDLGKVIAIQGVTVLPRGDMTNGHIAACEVYCSNDAAAWGAPVAAARWSDTQALQTIRFSQAVAARYVKIVVTAEVGGQPFAAIAELDVIPAP